MRTPIVAGNWKMNMTPTQAADLIADIRNRIIGATCDVVVCVPYVDIPVAKEALNGTVIKLGAQNMHFEKNGAYTGEISAAMLLELGVEYVIIGHSERREYFAETDETVNQKTRTALENGLIPIICVGESLEKREAGVTDEWNAAQTRAAFEGIPAQDAVKTVIAYEPIWAIGTGRTATDEQANEAIGAIRRTLCEIYGKDTAEAIRIQYGGSMNAKNAQGLMNQGEIDGGLIGGASLKAEDFAIIVAAVNAAGE